MQSIMTVAVRHRGVAIAAAVVALALAAGGAYGLWYLFLKGGGPAPVGDPSVPAAVASAQATASASSSAGASTSAAAGGSAGASSGSGSSGVAGRWNVDTSIGSFSDFSDSFVGYRVQEQLASIGANTAVGRTPNVSGSLTIDGTTLTATQITADLTGLKSDDDRRDGQLSHQGIQTSTYPTATFMLTSPIELGSVADGQTIDVTAKGKLTLHGVTREVEIPLKAKLSGNVIVVTGSLDISFADYGITKPNSFAVLSIADTGTLELQLFFTKA
jgi:polyisoprenoid-binding protein YceI